MTEEVQRIPQADIDAAARRFALRSASVLLRAMAEEDMTVEDVARRLGTTTPPVIRVLLGRNWRDFREVAAIALAMGLEIIPTCERINSPRGQA